MDTVKKVLAALLFIMTGAFLYQRSRANSAEAVADNQEMLEKLNEGNKEIAKNDGQLESEEAKREEIRKETDAKKADAPNTDDADFFNNRK